MQSLDFGEFDQEAQKTIVKSENCKDVTLSVQTVLKMNNTISDPAQR